MDEDAAALINLFEAGQRGSQKKYVSLYAGNLPDPNRARHFPPRNKESMAPDPPPQPPMKPVPAKKVSKGVAARTSLCAGRLQIHSSPIPPPPPPPESSIPPASPPLKMEQKREEATDYEATKKFNEDRLKHAAKVRVRVGVKGYPWIL